jgi:hypothetical protein
MDESAVKSLNKNERALAEIMKLQRALLGKAVECDRDLR